MDALKSDEGRVRHIRPEERRPGHPTPGMRREEAVATAGMWAGVVHTEPGMVSGWHHHGDYETTIYVVAGVMRMESGPGGTCVQEAQPGDFFHVPRRAVHREGNPTAADGLAVIVRAGTGEPVINVDGPEPN